MTAPADGLSLQANGLVDQLPTQMEEPVQPQSAVVRETAPAADDKICWLEVRQTPYPPDQQVELLHLQAEAEALLLQLQAMHQRRQNGAKILVGNP